MLIPSAELQCLHVPAASIGHYLGKVIQLLIPIKTENKQTNHHNTKQY